MPWVTLDSGQHVFIGERGEFMPSGPGGSGVAVVYGKRVAMLPGQEAMQKAVAAGKQLPMTKEQMAVFRAAQGDRGLSLAAAYVSTATGEPQAKVLRDTSRNIRLAVQRHKSGQLTLKALRRDQRTDRDLAVQQKKFWMDAMGSGKWGVSGESASRELAFAGLRIRARAKTIAILTHK